nr:hypothetical protein [Candidatus Sigynarchaeota archaeon]
MAKKKAFDCNQPLTDITLESLADFFLPGREGIRWGGNLVQTVKSSIWKGRDLCWWYRLLEEAAPHVKAIDREWCAIFNDPDFLVKHPGCEEYVIDTDGTRIARASISQGSLFIILPRIFDDDDYKSVMVHLNRVGFEDEFYNAWRQRLGKWVIPLRPEGMPGPFWRDAGRSHEGVLIRLQAVFWAAERRYGDIEAHWHNLLKQPDPVNTLTDKMVALDSFDVFEVAKLDGQIDMLILLLRIFDDREYKHFMRRPGMPARVMKFVSSWRHEVGKWVLPPPPESKPAAALPGDGGEESLEEELRHVYPVLREAAPHINAIIDEWHTFTSSMAMNDPRRNWFVFDNTIIRSIICRSGPGMEAVMALRIFDDREYKHALRHLMRVSHAETFINAWRQRLGKWVIPLRAEGEPGPFWRGEGRVLAPDLCQTCNMLGEAAPHAAAIEREWDDALTQASTKHGNHTPGLSPSPGPGVASAGESGINNNNSSSSNSSVAGEGGTTILDVVERIFDDDSYKEAMRCASKASFAEAFCNAWRQRLGKWVIPLRPEGEPGPFWRANGTRI